MLTLENMTNICVFRGCPLRTILPIGKRSQVLGVAFWKSWLNYIDVAVSVISVASRPKLKRSFCLNVMAPIFLKIQMILGKDRTRIAKFLGCLICCHVVVFPFFDC